MVLDNMMKRSSLVIGTLGVLVLWICAWLFFPPVVSSNARIPNSADAIARGEYLVIAGGCISCHRSVEDEVSFAGGLGIETEFGTFYAPNITPDIETGIGSWSPQDFLRALKHGRTPTGNFYYPTFPYRAYARLIEQDVLDMAAYLLSLEPVSYRAPEAQVSRWLFRWTIAGWNRLADLSQAERESFDDELVARGAYLARNLAHCDECHTPRSYFGILDTKREYAGSQLIDETIEPIDAEALADWKSNNFDLFLLIGLKPDGEFVGGDMNEVIEHNTSKLTDEDRDALAAYFTRHN